MECKVDSSFRPSASLPPVDSLDDPSIQDSKVKEIARMAFSCLKTALIGLACITASLIAGWAFTTLFVSVGMPLTAALCTTSAIGLLTLGCIKIGCQNASSQRPKSAAPSSAQPLPIQAQTLPIQAPQRLIPQGPLEIPEDVKEALTREEPWKNPFNQWNFSSNKPAIEFKLPSAPGFRFMIENPASPDHNKDTFEQEFFGKFLAVRQEAAKICEDSKFDQLIIPRVTTFKIGELTVFAEEIPPHDPRECTQYELYRTKNLQLALKQLTTFLSKMSFNSISSWNMHIDQEGRIILTDLSLISRSSFDFRPNLISFLETEEQINTVLNTPLEQPQSNVQQRIQSNVQQRFSGGFLIIAKNKRLKQLAREQNIANFHQDHGITADKAPQLLNETDALEKIERHLNLDTPYSIAPHQNKRYTSIYLKQFSNPLETQTTLRELAQAIIKEVNAKIQSPSNNDQPLFKRRQKKIFYEFNYSIKSPLSQKARGLPILAEAPSEEVKLSTKTCIIQILDALRLAGLIFDIEENNPLITAQF